MLRGRLRFPRSERCRLLLTTTVIVLIGLAAIMLTFGAKMTMLWGPLMKTKINKCYSCSTDAPIYYRDQVIVLMYHHVSPEPKGEGYITPGRFAADLEQLKKNGYNIIPVDCLAAFTERKTVVPPNAVVVTFDDGNKDFYLHVFPILEKLRVPAAVFVIGGKMGSEDFLTWDQVRKMEKSGLVTIGGHTFNQHYRAHIASDRKQPASVACIYDPQSGTKETRGQYLQRMTSDSRLLQETFQTELGHTTPYFAYPYGGYSPDFTRVLQKSGFRYLFTVTKGSNRLDQDPALYHRVNAGKPKLSPEKLLCTVKTTVVYDGFFSKQPVAWSPVWDD